MNQLKTLFSSNIPMDCHILKGRLECESIDCFVFDENIVWLNPFRAVAIGGVKLKVPSDQLELARKILLHIKKGFLFDEEGGYPITEALQSEYDKQQDVLRIKSEIRSQPSLLDAPDEIKSTILSRDEIDLLLVAEKEFQTLSKQKFQFVWKDFLSELLDFDGNVFEYLRPKPVEYFQDKELVENYQSYDASGVDIPCPNCQSHNTSKGYAIDYKWDFLYLFLSLLLVIPFPLIRKKTHCFNCGYDFKN
ncbi:putative signal transducing protein [Carboxylicivirga linearis]|uniref:DUF2007 domain-containing protein n=1 Tax=Carboxylicivirga linearis TaxID=1628157 RepID=A0ABS5JWC1_9BACT|nr:DUF2007 domain-containing protein [Carboxylicivirga linearis]MBS2099207.1 DUF2007 domain-containing protein [Carboxylicivirga linearis]